jgi:preprotein translocase subunit SecD
MTRRPLKIIAVGLAAAAVLSLGYSVKVMADLTRHYRQLNAAAGTQMVLSPALVNPASVPEGEMQTAQTVIDRRLQSLHLAGSYRVIRQEENLVVELPRTDDLPYIASVISSVGEIDFISGDNAPVGRMLGNKPGQESVWGGYPILFSGREIETADLPNPDVGQIFYRLTLKPAAFNRVVKLIETRPGSYICMVMDGQVINCTAMYQPMGEVLEILPGLSSGQTVSLTDLALFIKSGPLPVPFTVNY